MAASAREKDYVHVLANSIAKLSGSPPEVRIDNIADFERHYDTYDLDTKLKSHLDFKPDIGHRCDWGERTGPGLRGRQDQVQCQFHEVLDGTQEQRPARHFRTQLFLGGQDQR